MRKAIMIAGLILAVGVIAPAGALGKAGGTDRPIKGHDGDPVALWHDDHPLRGDADSNRA